MSKTINLKIDGKEVQVPEGMNLVDAAAMNGMHIPNLCYLKDMKGIGACRLCMVEIEGMKAPLTACTTKVKEGMVVNTKSEKVQEIRKFVVDLILSMHPLDCMTCTKAGVCNLQKYAYEFELKESSFTRKKFGYPVDAANPFIKRDPDYCVLCARCTRVCKAQGTNVLEFSGRGVGAKVVTANDKPLQESGCTFCGSCVDACPVNALLEADRWRKGREWEYKKTESVCLSCGSGCNIVVSTKDGEIAKINSATQEGAEPGYICAVGRFGFDSLRSEARVKVPMVRKDGELQQTTWDEALGVVAEKLKAAGPNAAFITTGNILNEDAALLKRLAADVVKTANCDSTVSLYSDYDVMKAVSTADMGVADLFVVAGISPDQWTRVLPALDAGIRRKLDGGARLILIASGEAKISAAAAVVLKGDELKMIEQLAQAVISKGVKAPKELVSALAHVDPSDEAMNAAELFIASKSPVFLSSPGLYAAASNLSLIKGSAVCVPLEANAKGVILSGLVSEGKKFEEILASRTDALYVVGEVPVQSRPETGFLILQAAYMTGLAAQADVILPSAAGLESSGTIVDYLGRLREVVKTAGANGEAKVNSEIFIDVARAMGSSLKPAKDAEIKKALKTKAKPAFTPFKKGTDFKGDAVTFMEDTNRSVINGSRLLWLIETEKAVRA